MTFTFQQRVDYVAEHLQGSCDTLEKHTTQEERDNPAFMAALNDIVFLCDSCSWWCEVSEQSDRDDDMICNECND